LAALPKVLTPISGTLHVVMVVVAVIADVAKPRVSGGCGALELFRVSFSMEFFAISLSLTV
jgi:hypothetical protein